ncbi:hypothetical protein [Desulfopila aestuarii]|uniref:hypothetical protein n=1 Tax=Desulfopila aestuarii TaxID=231440 RepID=UPI000935CD6F|nr:hypothetical protein [Desulfopila aestuarii]
MIKNGASTNKSLPKSLIIQNPKSGRSGETVYVPRKLLVKLTDYVKGNDIAKSERIFPFSYVAAWSMVRKTGTLINIELRPHDLRRHAPRMPQDLELP